MRVVIAGGSGFIGKALTETFIKAGHEVYILTRKHKEDTKNLKYVQWLIDGSSPEKQLDNIDAFINLAGESIADGRWTNERKKRILDSRIKATQESIQLMKRLHPRPSMFINASAIGYYGSSLNDTFTEDSTSSEENFLTIVAQKWEEEARLAEELGIRTVMARIGLVLDKTEGALPKMVMPYKLFAGGNLGSGEQWYSWIHIDDLTSLFLFALEHENIKGPFNITAPTPLRMKDFGKVLSKVLQRPHYLPAPSFALKVLLGEMSILLLEGQKVIPEKALNHGFQFKYGKLEAALSEIFH